MASGKVGSRAHALWLRVDLRVDDNLALQAACKGAESLLPVFVFDPEVFRTPALAGAWKSGARRARFLLESVACMRRQLEKKGSGLAIAIGKPSEVVPRLCGECTEVSVTRGICSEESRDEAKVEKHLSRNKCKLNRVWGGMMYMPDECGCSPDNVPLMFTSFKNKAESKGRIRDPLPCPDKIPSLPVSEDAELKKSISEALQFLPTLEQLGYPAEEAAAAMQDDSRSVLKFVGGEEAALQRMQKWIFDDDKLKDYFEIRNGMKGEGYSSKFSPWLALGCISPRRIWKEAQRYEKERVKNKSTYWLIFELTWRDFFIYMGHSQGDKLFMIGGLTGDKTPWTGSKEKLENWKMGKTGDQLVDANMRELSATGFMSNRGRQNVASYLIFDLGVDWRYGAAHFEEMLLDYDPCSNWGNWVAAAGLTGQRVNRFNTKKQLNDYDPKREYVNHWLKGSGAGPSSARANAPSQPSSTADKIDMSLDDLAKNNRNDSGSKGKGKGKGGKGGYESGGKGKDGKDDIKRRRWAARKAGDADADY